MNSPSSDAPKEIEDLSRLTLVLEGAGLGSWDWWLQTNSVTFDRRWCGMLGLRLEDTPQSMTTWEERVHPDDKARASADLEAYIAGRTELYENVHRLRHENGGWVWILDRGRASERDADGKIVRFTGTHLDITAYKNAEALSESIQKIAGIGGWELDLHTMRTTWTPEIYRIHGIPVGAPTDKSAGIAFYPEHERPRLEALIAHCIAGTEFRQTFEFIDAQSCHRWVEVMGEPLFDANGRVDRIRGTFQDVTETVESRSRQLAEHAQLERLMRNSPGMVYQFRREPTGRMYFSFVSAKAFDIYEVSPEDFAKNPAIMLEMAAPAERDGLLQKIDESFKNLAPFEWKGGLATKSGGLKWIMAHSIPFKDADGTVTWDGLVVDITREVQIAERLELERAKSVHSAKLASLGEMAAGIAHEINNPLAVIHGMARALAKFAADPLELAKRIDTIVRSTERIAKIVNSMKKFARSSEAVAHKPVLLRSILAEALVLTEAKTKCHGVAISIACDFVGHIVCDELEIEQVLVNLINNAIDATSDCTHRWVALEVAEGADSVILRIRDSGAGVSREVQSKLFQPFFTTKVVGEGTGLGLSIVRSILDGHAATIELLAAEANTCFEIRFPRMG